MANQNLVMAMNLKGSITEKYINQPQHEGTLEQFSSQYHSKTVVKEHWLWISNNVWAGASRLVHDMSDWVAILGNLTTLLIDQLHVIIGTTHF